MTKEATKSAKPKWTSHSISISEELFAAMDELVATNPLLTRHRIHALAFRLGLRELKQHPERILEEAARL